MSALELGKELINSDSRKKGGLGYSVFHGQNALTLVKGRASVGIFPIVSSELKMASSYVHVC